MFAQPFKTLAFSSFCLRQSPRLFRLSERQRPSLYSTANGHNTKNSSSRIKWFWMPAGVGFALISLLQLRHIREREKRKNAHLDNEAIEKCIPSWQVTLFKVVPTRVLSRIWGKVNEIELPAFVRGNVIRLWSWAFDCCLEEADEEDVYKYPNLGAFFTRKLKPGVRVIDQENDLVCPVDGRVLHFGSLVNGKLEQVKGIPYSLESFVGPKSTFSHPTDKVDKTQLFHCILYLGPGDCHHFHSPTEWNIQARRHFPGELYSVSPWVMKGFKDVLCSNERVALFGNWKYGSFTMTAVGAYNVGSIIIAFDKELQTNKKKAKRGNFEEKMFVEKGASRGDHIGCFAMGSAVVLIFEAPEEFQFCIHPGQKVVLGQPLGTVGQKND